LSHPVLLILQYNFRLQLFFFFVTPDSTCEGGKRFTGGGGSLPTHAHAPRYLHTCGADKFLRTEHTYEIRLNWTTKGDVCHLSYSCYIPIPSRPPRLHQQNNTRWHVYIPWSC